MKNLASLAAAAMCACAPAITVTVENTVDADRSVQLVEIPIVSLRSLDIPDGQTFAVMQGGRVVPSQVTHDSMLVFQSGLDRRGTTSFVVRAGKPQEFPAMAFARFTPERHDDFIWENDRVAFRIYGASLEAVDGPSNGIDALYKRTSEMVLNSWYAGALGPDKISYHDDNGTGLDDYKVGRTLGAGGMAPIVDSALVLNSNFIDQQLLDSGPLRAAFRLRYPGGEERTISLDAGSQLSKIVQTYSSPVPTTVAAGYPLRGEQGSFKAVGNSAMMLSEPATEKSSGVYLGLILPTRTATAAVNSHALAIAPYSPAGVVYYTGYGWEKWGDWNAGSWEKYLADFEASLAAPFVVELTK